MKLKYAFTTFSLLLGGIVLWGCSGSNTAPKTPAPAATEHEGHDHTDHAASEALSEEVLANFADLSPEDRSLAEHQRICPVSDEPLGSMGAPIRVEVNGKPVFICCEGCKEELLAKPDEYIAKLKK